jgi:methionyl-tRNA synthetase
MPKFYITTTLPYINAEPHIGFAGEIIKADVIARFQREQGVDVFFNTGTDEHGKKIYDKAMDMKQDPITYANEFALKFDKLKNDLNLGYNSFSRTTSDLHVSAAQEFWRRCAANGDIYKKFYQVKYCVGCELEKTDSELVDGCCPFHPGKPLEVIEEENYFFKFSKYQGALLELYDKNKDFVVPAHRLKEVRQFVAGGLQDFSISRLKEKMPWGINVPDDNTQVMYVWFDALVNYISALGWPQNNTKFNEFWPGIQVAGKDNLRQQAAMWQAMLMSAGLPNSKQILIFGFITSAGQKMSKSIGNVVSPYGLVQKYGTDAVRYYLLSEILPFEDGDFTMEKMNDKYHSDLCNGLGNLVSRVSTLLEKNSIEFDSKDDVESQLIQKVKEKIDFYLFNEALSLIWHELRSCDETLSRLQPWKMTDRNEIKLILEPIAKKILIISRLLKPFLPVTATKIENQFSQKQVNKGDPLFPRLTS